MPSTARHQQDQLLMGTMNSTFNHTSVHVHIVHFKLCLPFFMHGSFWSHQGCIGWWDFMQQYLKQMALLFPESCRRILNNKVETQDNQWRLLNKLQLNLNIFLIYALTLTYYSPPKMVNKSMGLTESGNAHVYGCPDVMTHISILLLRNRYASCIWITQQLLCASFSWRFESMHLRCASRYPFTRSIECAILSILGCLK